MNINTSKRDFFKTSLYKKLNNKISSGVYNSIINNKKKNTGIVLNVFRFLISFVSALFFIIPLVAALLIYIKLEVTFVVSFYIFLLLLLAVFSFPWIPTCKGRRFKRNELKYIFVLLDLISEKLCVRKVDCIRFNKGADTYIYQNPITRRVTLSIGTPFFYLLDTDEKVALLSHELSHLKYGDNRLNHLQFLGLQSIENQISMLTVLNFSSIRENPYLTPLFPLVILFFLLKKLLIFLYYLLLHSGWWRSQFNEFMADLNGAEIAGKSVFINTLIKSYSYVDIHNIDKEYLLHHRDKEYLDFLSNRFKENYKYKLEKYKNMINKGDELNYTHPPVKMRIELLKVSDTGDGFNLLNSNTENLIINELRSNFRFYS